MVSRIKEIIQEPMFKVAVGVVIVLVTLFAFKYLVAHMAS